MERHPDLYLAEMDRAEQALCTVYFLAALPTETLQILLTGCAEILQLYSEQEGTAALLYCSDADALWSCLERYCEANRIHAGITSLYARPVLASGGTEKARRAALVGSGAEPEQFLHYFPSLRRRAFLDEALPALRRAGYAPQDFASPALRRLKQHDEAQGTDYFLSVCAYLEFGRSLKDAAAAIGVHRNTLAYRIGKVRELFGLDLDNRNLCFELLFSRNFFRDCGPTGTMPRDDAGHGDAAKQLWRAIKREPMPLSRAPGLCDLLYCNTASLSERQAQDLLRAAVSLFPSCEPAFDDRCTVLLFPAAGYAMREMKESLTRFLEENRCRGALLEGFSADRLPVVLRLAALLSHLGPSLLQQSLYTMDDIGSFALLTVLDREMDLPVFYCDEVMRILQHDYENGTAFANSLYLYLSSFLDLKRAASEVSRHRNTMEYQMKKLRRLLDIDSTDRQLVFEMMCTYRMLAVSEVI